MSAELQFTPVEQEQVETRPWPRYFARMIDVLLLSAIVIFVLAVIGTITLPDPTARFLALLEDGIVGTFLSNMLAIVMALPPIALLLACGQTPGKWLFGIRVRNQDGHRIGWRTSLHRELLVWIKGLGLGIPVATLIALIMSHSTLTDDRVTSWDKQLQCRVTHAPATLFWWVRAVFGGAIVIVANCYGIISIALWM